MKTLKYAVRFLMRSRSYTIINLLGLAFSLACCIILLRYIHRELTVDTHCVDREKVYALTRNEEGHRNFSIGNDDLKNEILQGATHVSLKLAEKEYLTYNQELYPADVLVADSTFFQLFPHEVIQGNVWQKAPEAAVLTADYARRLFGNDNPIGKVLHTSNGQEAVVTGIIERPENKSFLRFDVALAQYNKYGTQIDLLRFPPQTDIKRMRELFGKVRYTHYDQNPHPYTYQLISVKDLYWDDLLTGNALLVKGDRGQLSIIGGICLLIGLTGIINFVNLYLITTQKRRKDFGLRKVFGISSRSLFLHIWLENLLMAIAALLVAGLLVEVTQVPVERLLNLPYAYSKFDIWILCGSVLLLPLFTCLYPFLKNNYAPPITSIRSIGNGRQNVRGRMAFLFVQYILTFLLVIMAGYFNGQLSLMQDTHPGFRTENVMVAHLGKIWANTTPEQKANPFWGLGRIQALVERIKQCPEVEYVEPTDILHPQSWQVPYLNDKGETCNLYRYWASPEFFRMHGIRFVEGKLPQTKGDEGWGELQHFVANKEAMKILGYTSRRDGKIMEKSAKAGDSYAEASAIIGVVENHYGGHLTEGVKPILYQVREDISFMAMGTYQIAYKPGRLDELVTALHQIQQDIFGSPDFDYTLLENDVDKLYKNDRTVATLYTVFALIAIAISCLGLFGISLFDIRQRYREIGIRKINGARMKDLYRLLFRKYVVVLGAAFVLAVPIAYYLITIYTRDFAVKAPVGIGLFVIALLVVAVISLGTLFWQVRRAANINPADVMKTE